MPAGFFSSAELLSDILLFCVKIHSLVFVLFLRTMSLKKKDAQRFVPVGPGSHVTGPSKNATHDLLFHIFQLCEGAKMKLCTELSTLSTFFSVFSAPFSPSSKRTSVLWIVIKMGTFAFLVC